MDKKTLLKPFQDIKKEIETLKKNQALHVIVERFHAEKKDLEKKIEKTVQAEISKAKKFLNDQKKELNSLSKKVEAMMKKKKKAPAKKASKKKVTKKKSSR